MSLIMPYGKYKGIDATQIPEQYLVWLWKDLVGCKSLLNPDFEHPVFKKYDNLESIFDYINSDIIDKYKFEDLYPETKKLIINFGKHKGKLIDEIPSDYKKWLYEANKDKTTNTEYMKKILEQIKNEIENI